MQSVRVKSVYNLKIKIQSTSHGVILSIFKSSDFKECQVQL